MMKVESYLPNSNGIYRFILCNEDLTTQLDQLNTALKIHLKNDI